MADIPVVQPAAGAAAAAAVKASGKSKLPLIIIAAVVVLAGLGAGAWFMFGTAKKSATTVKHEATPAGPALYLALDPPFVVNFEAEQAVRFLQVAVQVMSRDPLTIELVKNNDPVVRNDLLLLFGNQRYEVLSTREGKESLRKQALSAIRRVISEAGGKPDHLEAVYFTAFVMQ